MPQTQMTTTRAGLPALLHNLARRFTDELLLDVDTMNDGNVRVLVTWPKDYTDPGDPGEDPQIVALREQLQEAQLETIRADGRAADAHARADALVLEIAERNRADSAAREANPS